MTSPKDDPTRTTLFVIEKWKLTAQHELADMEGWRDAEPERLWTDPWRDEPNGFYTDTTYLVGWLTTHHPKLDPQPLLDFYDYVRLWHEDRNASRLPSHADVSHVADNAALLLQAAEMAIHSQREAVRDANRKPVAEPVGANVISTDTTGWLRVSEAARKAGVDDGEISKACTSLAIHSVGKGKERRVDPAALKVWTQNRQRGREIRANVGVTATSPLKDEVSSGICEDCSETVTLKNGAGKCPKCGSTTFEPLRATLRNYAAPLRKTP